MLLEQLWDNWQYFIATCRWQLINFKEPGPIRCITITDFYTDRPVFAFADPG